MHVDVVPVEVGALPLLPAVPPQQEAVCKREGDVRDQDEQQDEGEHCGITEVDARERERKIGVNLDWGWAQQRGKRQKCDKCALVNAAFYV